MKGGTFGEIEEFFEKFLEKNTENENLESLIAPQNKKGVNFWAFWAC